jgi:hypothetical protein
MERSTGGRRKGIPARSRMFRLLGIPIIAAFLLPAAATRMVLIRASRKAVPWPSRLSNW